MSWVRITVKDLETGEEEAIEVENDYVLTCVGSCYLHSSNVFSNGTHVLTVKGSKGLKRQVDSTSVGDDPRDSSIDVVREQRK